MERLEDRVVPSLPDGTILVATSPSPFSYNDESSFPTGLIAVNPVTGEQPSLFTGNLFSVPTYVAQGPNQQVYVSDLTAFGTGAILQVDLVTGQQRLVAKDGFISGPNALVYVNGYLYVANEGDASGTIHSLVQVDPNTGQQRLITDGSSGGFSVPTGMVPGPGNTVYLTDEPGNVDGADSGKVWQINLTTGEQTLISSNDDTEGMLFNHPVDLALDARGNLIVVNTGSAVDAYSGSVIRVDPRTGAQSLISSFGQYTGVDSVDVGTDGTIFVGTISNAATPGQIYAVDPATGAQVLVASGGWLSQVEGIRILHALSQASTTTTVVSSANPSVFAQWVTFTATIAVQDQSASTPTGTVQFQIDGVNAGSPVALSTSGGVTTATFSTSLLTVGAHTITAVYSGDSTFAASAGILSGGQMVATLTGRTTATTLISSSSLSVSGQAVSFTAIINVQDSGAGVPTGSVQFWVDGSMVGQPVNVSSEGGLTTASFTTTALSVGSHTITAIYSGDGNFAASNGTLIGGQTIKQASTNIVITSSAGSLVDVGQTVTFTAIVAILFPGDGTATGTIQFQVDGNNVGSPVGLSMSAGLATASFSSASLAAGTHTISAIYSGDGSFAGSSGALPGGQTVSMAGTSMVLTSSVSPSVLGQLVIFTAFISVAAPGAGAPTGTVQFQVDGINMGVPASVITSGGLTMATFSTTSLTVGSHIITANYSGDGSFTGSAGMLTGGQTVATTTPTTTTTTLRSAANPSVFGQALVFTATIAPQSAGAGTPTGAVQFQIDGINFGSPVNVSTSGGVTIASLSMPALAVGNHSITAFYTGDGAFAGSVATLTGGQTVAKASTSGIVNASASPSVSGQTVTFTVTINAVAPGGGTPSGTVQFQIDGNNVGSPVNVTTSGGLITASFSTAALAVGTHTIAAYYGGDGNFTGTTALLSGGLVVKSGAGGNATATLDPATGLLSITGDADNNVITISQVSAGTVQVSGVGTTVNQGSNPATFSLVTGINVSLPNGNDSVSLTKLSVPGAVLIKAGSGSDMIALDTILANLISITTAGPGKDTITLNNTASGTTTISSGDNANISLIGVSSGSVKLAAGDHATITIYGLSSASDLSIALGDNTQSVTVKSSDVASLTIAENGATGNPSFDLENDTIGTNLTLAAGRGNNTVVLSHLSVGIQLLVYLGAGKNTLSADHVTALFGAIDGGLGGNNSYVDGGGNAGFVVIHFLGH